MSFSSDNQHLIVEQKKKSVVILEHLPYVLFHSYFISEFERVNDIRNLYVMWLQKTAQNYPISVSTFLFSL